MTIQHPLTPFAAAFHPREVRALMLAGAIGGVLAGGAALVFNPHFTIEMPLMSRVTEAARFAAIIGAILGAAIGAADGLARRNVARALPGAFIGLIFGALGNAVAVGLTTYLVGDRMLFSPMFLVLEMVQTALLGVALGFSWAIPSGAERKIELGVLGGAIGGALVGLVSALLPQLGPDILFIIVGFGIGAGIGVTEEVARRAWLEVTAGPLCGARFILYPHPMHLGRHPRSAIAIADPGLTPLHAAITPDATDYVLTTPDPDAVVRVNDRRFNKHYLHDGDAISAGETVLVYHRRGQEE